MNTIQSKDDLISKLKLDLLDITEQRYNSLDSNARTSDAVENRIRDLNTRL